MKRTVLARLLPLCEGGFSTDGYTVKMTDLRSSAPAVFVNGTSAVNYIEITIDPRSFYLLGTVFGISTVSEIVVTTDLPR